MLTLADYDSADWVTFLKANGHDFSNNPGLRIGMLDPQVTPKEETFLSGRERENYPDYVSQEGVPTWQQLKNVTISYNNKTVQNTLKTRLHHGPAQHPDIGDDFDEICA
jgi:hypothetical protein